MRRILIAATFILAASPVWAQSGPPGADHAAPPSALITPEMGDALQDLGRAMLRLFNVLPRYKAPRVMDNGDILIPRAPNPGPLFPVPRPEADGTTRPIAT